MMKSGQKSTYPLIESIGAWDGITPYLPYHQKRIDRTFKQLYPGKPPFDLESILDEVQFPMGKLKVRFFYNDSSYRLEYDNYQRPFINSLELKESDDISYDFKYTKRDQLEDIYNQRTKAEDVLIFKKGLLTDAFYANIVCIVDRELLTPADPLLKGVMRAYLLDRKIIQAAHIDRELLLKAKGVFLINALNPLSTSPYVPIQNIYF